MAVDTHKPLYSLSLSLQASKCADLERLAVDTHGLFLTPRGCCLPFGTMDLAVAAAGTETGAGFKVRGGRGLCHLCEEGRHRVDLPSSCVTGTVAGRDVERKGGRVGIVQRRIFSTCLIVTSTLLPPPPFPLRAGRPG